MKTLIQSTLCAALLLAVPAMAKTPPAQTHHCVKDGAVLEKTHKECTKEGGKWEKMTAAKPADAKPAEPAKADPAPAKTDDAAPAPATAPAK